MSEIIVWYISMCEIQNFRKTDTKLSISLSGNRIAEDRYEYDNDLNSNLLYLLINYLNDTSDSTSRTNPIVHKITKLDRA